MNLAKGKAEVIVKKTQPILQIDRAARARRGRKCKLESCCSVTPWTACCHIPMELHWELKALLQCTHTMPQGADRWEKQGQSMEITSRAAWLLL